MPITVRLARLNTVSLIPTQIEGTRMWVAMVGWATDDEAFGQDGPNYGAQKRAACSVQAAVSYADSLAYQPPGQTPRAAPRIPKCEGDNRPDLVTEAAHPYFGMREA